MFGLRSQRLRRRLSNPTSGSLRRRACERRRGEETRAQGERIARELIAQRLVEKLENQRKSRQELATYEPWGKAGGGAPNPRGIRFSNLRATGIFPEDELRGISIYEACHQLETSKSRRKRQTPVRLREDPQLCYAENLRKSVDNDIRYKLPIEQQIDYKQILDDMVHKKKAAAKDEIKRNLEYERKMLTMDGPWGKPGPGGTIWRNPRNIGLNFSKSMGWTDNQIFSALKGDYRRQKTSSFTLPKVKRDDDLKVYPPHKETKKLSSIEKLPDIVHDGSPNGCRRQERKVEDKGTVNDPKGKSKSCIKNKRYVKRLSNIEKVRRILYDDYPNSVNEEDFASEKKLTPEKAILRMTGGIELVPLLARRRRVEARTLPSSDVTRPPEQPCQWREVFHDEYLKQLKQQMREKCAHQEAICIQECRRNSAESVKQHHATWSSLWGRPGHGAPQLRGRYARRNLAQLLYVAPIANAQPITNP